VDGGDGSASVGLEAQQETAVTAMATRLRSDPSSDPTTGAEIGSEVAPTDDTA
ncbi:manganese catalase family protein, partial [Paraburkholderia sp. JPY303]|nr:manganese catalase family protein [Paraburkholderia atlantica]